MGRREETKREEKVEKFNKKNNVSKYIIYLKMMSLIRKHKFWVETYIKVGLWDELFRTKTRFHYWKYKVLDYLFYFLSLQTSKSLKNIKVHKPTLYASSSFSCFSRTFNKMVPIFQNDFIFFNWHRKESFVTFFFPLVCFLLFSTKVLHSGMVKV